MAGLPPVSLCAWPAAARPGAVPLLGVRWLLLPGLSRPPAPGLWRSFRAGQRVGCPPWFMPWLSPLPGWLARSLGLAFVRVSWPAAPPGPLLRGCVVVLRLRCRQVGAGAQARKGGLLRRPTDHAALGSPALCSPRRTRPKVAGQDANDQGRSPCPLALWAWPSTMLAGHRSGGSHEWMPPIRCPGRTFDSPKKVKSCWLLQGEKPKFCWPQQGERGGQHIPAFCRSGW